MKKVISLLAIMMSVLLTVPVFATTVGSGYATNDAAVASNSGGWDYSAPDDPADMMDVQKVSTEDFANRLNEKGNDVINILQLIGKWVCIGAFIMGIICVIVGCFGNKRLMVGGFIALILAGVCYAGIVCGREIVQFIASWAAS